jgi:hypothetical protein
MLLSNEELVGRVIRMYSTQLTICEITMKGFLTLNR